MTNILSLLTIAGQIILGGALSLYLLEKVLRKEITVWKKLKKVIGKYGLAFALIVALIATFGSLFYSEVAQYNPCKLCWYQRIFMYPLVVLLWVAIMKNYRKEIKAYVVSISLIGGSISIYHYYLQRFGDPSVPCSVVGVSQSCARSEFLNFGYITIPLMALTAFLLIITFMSYYPLVRK